MEKRVSGKAITSLVCGIASILVPFAGFALGILGVVFGIIAKSEIKRSESEIGGEGMAIAGFVCGIVGLVTNGIMIAVLTTIFGTIGTLFNSVIWNTV
ncbi:DUF4190 domain-containing protein [candidate division WOR-3 bacterium]|nr:DUF4190 domain-containing protein [candidate division WOR-3 bacterium]